MIVNLASGAELDITKAKWQDAHNLFKVFMREIGDINLVPGQSMGQNLLKEIIKKTLGSEELDKALWPCIQN